MKQSDTLVLFASPHGDGNTRTLLDVFLNNENIKEYNFFDCYQVLPKPCIDCGYCKKIFSCVFRDLDGFYQALEECNRLIIASPVYNNGFPAPLKAVIDRMQVYFHARFKRGIKTPIKTAKRADILMTSGSKKNCKEAVLAQILPCFTIINAKLDRFINVMGLDDCEDIDSLINKQIVTSESIQKGGTEIWN